MLTIPTILMVFLAVMWFGYTESGALVAVMAVVTPYVAVNMYEGTRAMEIDMAITFKASRLLRLRGVYLPQLLPYIFAAFRYAFGITWKIVALAETFGLKFGIGYMFYFWFQQFNMTQVLAWIIMFVVCMLLLEHLIFARLERRAFAWRSSTFAEDWMRSGAAPDQPNFNSRLRPSINRVPEVRVQAPLLRSGLQRRQDRDPLTRRCAASARSAARALCATMPLSRSLAV
jgi:hypothetical protein